MRRRVSPRLGPALSVTCRCRRRGEMSVLAAAVGGKESLIRPARRSWSKMEQKPPCGLGTWYCTCSTDKVTPKYSRFRKSGLLPLQLEFLRKKENRTKRRMTRPNRHSSEDVCGSEAGVGQIHRLRLWPCNRQQRRGLARTGMAAAAVGLRPCAVDAPHASRGRATDPWRSSWGRTLTLACLLPRTQLWHLF
jgi:hypothetical protein